LNEIFNPLEREEKNYQRTKDSICDGKLAGSGWNRGFLGKSGILALKTKIFIDSFSFLE